MIKMIVFSKRVSSGGREWIHPRGVINPCVWYMKLIWMQWLLVDCYGSVVFKGNTRAFSIDGISPGGEGCGFVMKCDCRISVSGIFFPRCTRELWFRWVQYPTVLGFCFARVRVFECPCTLSRYGSFVLTGWTGGDHNVWDPRHDFWWWWGAPFHRRLQEGNTKYFPK